MKKVKLISLLHKIRRHWLLALLIVVGILFQTDIAVQIVYPSDRLLPMQNLDGVSLGGWQKSDAVKRLDILYLDSPVNIFWPIKNSIFITEIVTNRTVS